MHTLHSLLLFLAGAIVIPTSSAQEIRVKLDPKMVVNEAEVGEPAGLVDEQDRIIGPPIGQPSSAWRINSRYWKKFPYSAYIDLGTKKNLASLWLFDTNSHGDLVISCGEPGKWRELRTYNCGTYMKWVRLPMNVNTRYVRLTRKTPGAQFTEVALYEYTPEAWQALLEKKGAEAKARAEKEAALAKAREEMRKRPQIDLGLPFGKLYLVDEINCASSLPDHDFYEDPPGASQIQNILGRPCRVIRKTAGEAALFSYRIGKRKLLTPGEAYVLTVEYPEDAPRTILVRNSGCEISRGFHTGTTVGDTLHPKYVNNLNESLRVPLSDKYKTWTLFFHLHDRFPDRKFPRGDKERPLSPEDGFRVTIAQFSAENIPASRGAAVSRIRLFAVPDARALEAAMHLPPPELPRRHLFVREEMADGVIGSVKNKKRGITNAIDWYRYKASNLRFLGMDTYTKDLLEFGACQHWDPTEGGGNRWVYFNSEHKGLWKQIVHLMRKEGLNILPYYEYSGSKGSNGLGPQRRAKPLTRNHAYTHISWIESANADITDPDTYADFAKMLDLTVLRYRDDAHFLGAWLRPRGQIPMGFGDATRARFASEANGGHPVSREQLIADMALLERYEDWWYGKRRQFLAAMRRHLLEDGLQAPNILYTPLTTESGVPFPTWEPRIVTDDADFWKRIFEQPAHRMNNRKMAPVPFREVMEKNLYLEALLSAPLNWGKWEVPHSNPPPDPALYKDTEGVLMTHPINRGYTAASPATFEAFRGRAGLAIVHFYPLNENMLFDRNDKPKQGYFVADIERAGPYCMLAEAWAVANGDPNWIGYLSSNSYGRGFPKYVRNFNAAYLALPALPSQRLERASSDPEVVVRIIRTRKQGAYLAVINTGLIGKKKVTIIPPAQGRVTELATGQDFELQGGRFQVSLYPCQLRSFHIR